LHLSSFARQPETTSQHQSRVDGSVNPRDLLAAVGFSDTCFSMSSVNTLFNFILGGVEVSLLRFDPQAMYH